MIILPWWCDVSDTGNADIRMSGILCCHYQQYDTQKILSICSTSSTTILTAQCYRPVGRIWGIIIIIPHIRPTGR